MTTWKPPQRSVVVRPSASVIVARLPSASKPWRVTAPPGPNTAQSRPHVS
ncbi:hypothetical protein [Sorangium sp. So ce1335]